MPHSPEQHRAYVEDNRAQIYAQQAEYRSRPEVKQAMASRGARHHLMARYGLTHDDIEAMLDTQKGECPICFKDIRKCWNVDHNHETGKVRKLLCPNCNKALGLFRDDPEVVARAAQYLILEEAA